MLTCENHVHEGLRVQSSLSIGKCRCHWFYSIQRADHNIIIVGGPSTSRLHNNMNIIHNNIMSYEYCYEDVNVRSLKISRVFKFHWE